jgi:enamine deaminase RidA (YjgF/YER057c/UK114 family)
MSLTYREMLHGPRGDLRVVGSSFEPAPGRAVEWHLSVTGRAGARPETELAELEAAYQAAQVEWGLGRGSAVWRRLFTARWEHTHASLGSSSLSGSLADPVALSLVEQPAVPHGALALWAYHVSDQTPFHKQSVPLGVAVKRAGRTHLWACNLVDPRPEQGVVEQTRHVLGTYAAWLGARGGQLREDLVRTWVYLDDIGSDYPAMTEARRELFAEHGLTADTHFVASTGIQGRAGSGAARIGLDAYAVIGPTATARSYLSAPSHLCQATAYGSSFERGVAITYGDRRQIYVSGTASIDPAGLVLFPGDVARQTARALGNVAALLQGVRARLADIAQAIVYLKDPRDYRIVHQVLATELGPVPILFVHAPICRPEWLVEIECIALVADGDPGQERF